EGFADDPAVFALIDELDRAEGFGVVGGLQGFAGVGQAGEAVEELAGHGRALLGADGLAEFGEAFAEAADTAFFVGDLGVAGALLADLGAAHLSGGVALHDPAVVADEARHDRVHVAVGGDLVVLDSEPGVEGDAVAGEDHAGREVVFLGVVVKGGVVAVEV